VTAEASLVAADRAARDAALDVGRSFIVQAPAGSGKTELLIQRYLRLLGVVEQPEEILAITFTRKAAFEMQARVLAALQDAKDGKTAAEAHERVTMGAATRALARDRQMDWRLVESPHRLRIQTIDALNASIARSRPLSSGLGAATDVVSDDAARSIYRSAAAATLDWLVSGGDDGAAVEQLLVHLDNNAALYLAHIARMLETRDQWLGMTGTGRDARADNSGVRARLEQLIADQVVAHLARLRRLIPEEFVPALLRLATYAAASL
jgi:ATP-dependent helicase/nuclease subunit A